MFNIGDKVVYPAQGAGIIEAIEEKNFSGMIQKYFIIRITSNNLTVMLPESTIDQSDLRLINDESALKDVLLILNDSASCIEKCSSNKELYELFKTKLKSGSMKKSAEVFRDLMHIHDIKSLNNTEKMLLDRARRLLAGEIALIKDITNKMADQYIKEIIH